MVISSLAAWWQSTDEVTRTGDLGPAGRGTRRPRKGGSAGAGCGAAARSLLLCRGPELWDCGCPLRGFISCFYPPGSQSKHSHSPSEISFPFLCSDLALTARLQTAELGQWLRLAFCSPAATSMPPQEGEHGEATAAGPAFRVPPRSRPPFPPL